MNLDEIAFENQIINMLKKDVMENVVGSYPKDNMNFPLIVTSLNTTPNQYFMNKDTARTRVILSIRIWQTTKTKTIRTKIKVEEILLNFGFTRLNPTDIIIDNTNGKYYMEEQFVINYNNVTGNLERSI